MLSTMTQAPVKRTEHFTAQHWTFVDCENLRSVWPPCWAPGWVLFGEVWSRSNFSLNKRWATQHFLCFSKCWVLFSAFDQSLNICSVRVCAVGECWREVQPCSAKCSVRLTGALRGYTSPVKNVKHYIYSTQGKLNNSDTGIVVVLLSF